PLGILMEPIDELSGGVGSTLQGEGERLVPGDPDRACARPLSAGTVPPLGLLDDILEQTDRDEGVDRYVAREPFVRRVPSPLETGHRGPQRRKCVLVSSRPPLELTLQQQIGRRLTEHPRE